MSARGDAHAFRSGPPERSRAGRRRDADEDRSAAAGCGRRKGIENRSPESALRLTKGHRAEPANASEACPQGLHCAPDTCLLDSPRCTMPTATVPTPRLAREPGELRDHEHCATYAETRTCNARREVGWSDRLLRIPRSLLRVVLLRTVSQSAVDGAHRLPVSLLRARIALRCIRHIPSPGRRLLAHRRTRSGGLLRSCRFCALGCRLSGAGCSARGLRRLGALFRACMIRCGFSSLTGLRLFRLFRLRFLCTSACISGGSARTLNERRASS